MIAFNRLILLSPIINTLIFQANHLIQLIIIMAAYISTYSVVHIIQISGRATISLNYKRNFELWVLICCMANVEFLHTKCLQNN